MTESAEKQKRPFKKARELLKRSGLTPFFKETLSEERPWQIMATLNLGTNRDKNRGFMKFVGQTVSGPENSDNSSGNMIVYRIDAKGNTITIYSFDKPKRISGLKNGLLKKEVIKASEEAAANPGIFIRDENEETITAIYRKNRGSSVKSSETIVLPID